MYTYLRNIGPPFLHGVFLFSKVWVSDSKLWWLSYSCLLEPHLVILTSGKGIAWAYFFAHKSLSEELSSLHHVSYFLRKEIMEPTLCVLLDCPSFDHACKCLFGVFFRDKVMWNEIWLFTRSCFYNELLEFQSYSEKKNHFDVCLKLTCSEKFKQFPWIGLHKCEVMFCWLKRI